MKMKSAGLTLWVSILFIASAGAQNGKWKLQYKFKNDQVLRYQTERHDSSEIEFGGQTMDRSMTLWSRQSIHVSNAKAGHSYEITVKTDSVWNDQEPTDGQSTVVMRRGGGSGGQRNTVRMGGPGGRGPEEYEMNAYGRSLTKDPVATPLILALPEDPVSMNETWDFNYTIESRGRSKGQTTIEGKCLLYSVEKQNGDDIALIIVNTDTKGNREFSGEVNGMSFSSKSQSSGSATHLVYFNATKGYIQEIISEEVDETASDMGGSSNSMRRKSKSTIKLENQ